MNKLITMFATITIATSTTISGIEFISPSAPVHAAKYSKINKSLKKALNEDQGFANGTLDEDGNPTENGEPNPDYEYANYITSIKFTGGTDVDIHVNNEFLSLSKDEKSDVISHAESLAASVLYQKGKIKSNDVKEGLIVEVFNGARSIGLSKVLDHKEYKFDE